MIKHTDADKWNLIYQTSAHGSLRPARVLSENQHLLPDKGKALDVASGLGANALLLAELFFSKVSWLGELKKPLIAPESGLTFVLSSL